MQPNKNHIKALTGLRFFAATLVMMMHFSEYINLPESILPIIRAGGIGVSFFFVLSGFLLYLRYGDIFESRLNKNELKKFFLGRFFRIYPAYFLGLIIVTVINFVAFKKFNLNPSFADASISGWVVNLVALQTFSGNLLIQQFWNAPSWSVSTEFFFYFSFPFFLFYITSKINTRFNIKLTIFLFFVLWILLRLTVIFGAFAGWFDKVFWVDYISDRNFFWRFWEFGIGILSSKIFLSKGFAFAKSEFIRNIAIIFSIAIVLLIAYLPWPSNEMSQLLMRVLRLGILNVLPFIFIIAIFCIGKNFLSGIMENKFIVYLGECSFAIYIYHWSFWLLLENMRRLHIDFSEKFVILCMLGTIVFSMISYSFYENPIKKLATRKFIKY